MLTLYGVTVTGRRLTVILEEVRNFVKDHSDNDYGPGNEGYDPGNEGYDPGNEGYDPGNEDYDPGNEGYDPGNEGYDPGNEGYDPGNEGYDPGNEGYDPGNEDDDDWNYSYGASAPRGRQSLADRSANGKHLCVLSRGSSLLECFPLASITTRDVLLGSDCLCMLSVHAQFLCGANVSE